MIDKILSVKASSGTMTFFMAMHILIMFGSAEDGETYYFEMIMFLTLTLLAASTFFMAVSYTHLTLPTICSV